LTGTLTGMVAGIALGIAAAVLFTVSNPEIRSAVIVGAGLETPTPPPTSHGEYAARVMAQAMNPNLVYADEAEVAALLASAPVEPEQLVVASPVEEDLRENAMLVFIVLGALTVLSWAMIMWGLSSYGQAVAGAGVE
jgi:hypothetical protein